MIGDFAGHQVQLFQILSLLCNDLHTPETQKWWSHYRIPAKPAQDDPTSTTRGQSSAAQTAQSSALSTPVQGISGTLVFSAVMLHTHLLSGFTTAFLISIL